MDRFYVLGYFSQNEFFDFTNKYWGQWPPIPQAVGGMPCMVQWRDTFIVFGGTQAPTFVQLFDHATQVDPQRIIKKFSYTRVAVQHVSQRNRFTSCGPVFDSWHYPITFFSPIKNYLILPRFINGFVKKCDRVLMKSIKPIQHYKKLLFAKNQVHYRGER